MNAFENLGVDDFAIARSALRLFADRAASEGHERLSRQLDSAAIDGAFSFRPLWEDEVGRSMLYFCTLRNSHAKESPAVADAFNDLTIAAQDELVSRKAAWDSIVDAYYNRPAAGVAEIILDEDIAA